ncbi:MAG: DNA mismatch repair protein MutS, partial [Candidatus Woesearchaeota archaeon]
MTTLTPGMRQYMEQKQKYPDCVLLFRMGDFYETFFDDAITISQVLNITLTSRGKGESKAPLAGIPYHSLDRYLGKLVSAGHKVALCEQVEDPKEAKGIVKREVVRVITPGTIVEDSMLSEKTHNYIASIFGDGQEFGIAFVDISTGDFQFTEGSLKTIFHEIARKKTAEVLISYGHEKIENFCKQHAIFVNRVEDKKFWMPNAVTQLQKQFRKSPQDLGFVEKDFALCAVGSLLDYLFETQKQTLQFLKKPSFFTPDKGMVLDATTMRNLELLKNATDGSQRGTLLSVLDETVNAMGGRLLRQWITHPLKDKQEIDTRLDAVESLTKNIMLCDDIRESLSEMFDIERLVSRMGYKMTRPADLVTLKHSLQKLPYIQELLAQIHNDYFMTLQQFEDVSEVVSLIDAAIAEESEGSEVIRSGSGYSQGGSGRREIGIIKRGYHEELDTLYELKFNTKKAIRTLEEKEQEKTGMSLKVGYNKVFGYYIEVTNKFKDMVPDHYIRKQTLVNGERFITQELKEFEETLLNAETKALVIESEILETVIQKVVEHTTQLQAIATRIATIDVLCSLAKTAYTHNYVKPTMCETY